MNNRILMQYALNIILLLCGYIYLLQLVIKRTKNVRAIPTIAVLLLVIYLVIAVPLFALISSFGNSDMMLLSMLMLVSCIAVFNILYNILKYFRYLNKGMLVLFLIYLLAVGYITIFSRDGSNDMTIGLIRFDDMEQAIRTHSFAPIRHMGLNIAMFMPIGCTFPMIHLTRLEKWGYAAVLGMMLSTGIESLQMVLRLGQADLMDIMMNIIGSLIGYGIFKVTRYLYNFERK
ncbi:MAG: VanZ family protein [Eubacteriales bacterium]|nr:VanZ family protein [Eubacteriales bacterium]